MWLIVVFFINDLKKLFVDILYEIFGVIGKILILLLFCINIWNVLVFFNYWFNFLEIIGFLIWIMKFIFKFKLFLNNKLYV